MVGTRAASARVKIASEMSPSRRGSAPAARGSSPDALIRHRSGILVGLRLSVFDDTRVSSDFLTEYASTVEAGLASASILPRIRSRRLDYR